MTIERVGCDAACAETIQYSPDKAEPSNDLTLHFPAISLSNAFCHLLKEAASIASVLTRSTGLAVCIRLEKRAARVGWAVVELVDTITIRRGRGRHNWNKTSTYVGS
jgi:hypothetical protein